MRAELAPEHDESTERLFARLLGAGREEKDMPLGVLVALHGRPTEEVIGRSIDLCGSEDAHIRTIGLRILRELNHRFVGREPMWAPIEPIVIGIAAGDPDPDVVQWAISCLGYQPSGMAAVRTVVDRAVHADPGVRFAPNQLGSSMSDDVEGDIDGDACVAVMNRYGLLTKRDAINFALREIAAAHPRSDARAMRGSGWAGDLDEMRSTRNP